MTGGGHVDQSATPGDDGQSDDEETVTALARWTYNRLLLIVVVLTAVGFTVEVLVSLFADETNRNVSRVVATCDWIVKSGVGALVGLLAGKQVR